MFNPDSINRISKGIRRTEQIPTSDAGEFNRAQTIQWPYNDYVYPTTGPVSGLHLGYIKPFTTLSGGVGDFIDRTDVPVLIRTPTLQTLALNKPYWGRCEDFVSGVDVVSGTYPTYIVDDPSTVTFSSGIIVSGMINSGNLSVVDWIQNIYAPVTYNSYTNLTNTQVSLSSGSTSLLLNSSGVPKLTFLTSGTSQVPGLANIVSSGMSKKPDDGQLLYVQNRGKFKVNLNHEDLSVSGLFRFLVPDHTNYELYPDNGCILEYDRSSLSSGGRWRWDTPSVFMSRNSGGATGLVYSPNNAGGDDWYLAANRTWMPPPSTSGITLIKPTFGTAPNLNYTATTVVASVYLAVSGTQATITMHGNNPLMLSFTGQIGSTSNVDSINFRVIVDSGLVYGLDPTFTCSTIAIGGNVGGPTTLAPIIVNPVSSGNHTIGVDWIHTVGAASVALTSYGLTWLEILPGGASG